MDDRRHTIPVDKVDGHGTRGQFFTIDEAGSISATTLDQLVPKASPAPDAIRRTTQLDRWREEMAAKTVAEGRPVGDKLDTLIADRGKTHGNFTDHARVTQRLKEVILDERHLRQERGQPQLSFETLEFLDMTTHKIGRVLAGDADFRDHFDDIGGYARLVAERCTK